MPVFSFASEARADAPTPQYNAPVWIGILLLYGTAFTLLRSTAALWATGHLFSLWFPAAGLRFAFLWWAGPRIAPAAALAEMLISVLTGLVSIGPQPVMGILGVLGPCVVYGLVIAVVQRRMKLREPGHGFDPLPFAMAALLAPIAACFAALSWALPMAMERGPIDWQLLFSALLVFTLGDMLGVLMLAPPLLWAVEWFRSARRAPVNLSIAHPLEIVFILVSAWVLVWIMQHVGFGLVLAPVLLATCWVGIRGGRMAAWVAILFSAIVILPMTGSGMSDAARIEVHMMLASIATGGYLAGSYSDAQKRAAAEIARRDRLLFHAERLKTLRAMSVGVIHEVSQPLSTISIEANGLLAATAAERPDIGQVREMSGLIARKAADLSELIRRLRRFGEGGGDRSGEIAARAVARDLVELAAGEARGAGVRLELREGPDIAVPGNDVEIRQALLNLVRNAVSAAPKPGGTVWIGWLADEGEAIFTVENAIDSASVPHPGMGVGLLITRAIARAHGGGVRVDHPAAQRFRVSLHLPILERPMQQ